MASQNTVAFIRGFQFILFDKHILAAGKIIYWELIFHSM